MAEFNFFCSGMYNAAMTYQHRPRDSVEQPFEGHPLYGAVHDVIPDTRLIDFMSAFRKMADKILNPDSNSKGDEINPIEEYQPEEEFDAIDITGQDRDLSAPRPPYDPRKYYRMFNIERLAVPVLEMDPSAKTTRLITRFFESQDFGAVEQDARNEMARHPYIGQPCLTFNRVEGTGRLMPGVDSDTIYQKLSLFPDTSKDQKFHTVMSIEQEKLVAEIRKRLKQEILPWSLNPTLTFAVLRKQITPVQYRKILMGANGLLWETKTVGKTKRKIAVPRPLVVEIDKTLDIYSRSERSKKRR